MYNSVINGGTIMSIKSLNLLKNPSIKKRLYTLSLISVITITTGCSSSKSNNNQEGQKQNSISMEASKETSIYLDEKSPEIYSIVTLSNGKKRKILLSDEPHLYEAFIEKTKMKVYLSDENRNRLSNNFDELSLLSNYSYYTNGGIMLGTYTKVETDKQYEYFVGITLRQDSTGKSLKPSITLLDNNGTELCTFNGEFQALIENIVVIRDYFECDRAPGSPATYLYNYITGEKSKIHQAVKIFKYEQEQNEEKAYLIGLDYYRDNNENLKWMYSFYDENLKIIATASEDEIENWYKNNNMDAFYANGDYYDYFKSIYQSISVEKNKQLILKKDS